MITGAGTEKVLTESGRREQGLSHTVTRVLSFPALCHHREECIFFMNSDGTLIVFLHTHL